ncbi:MAG: hypothetical protein WC373_12005 [Smithella sp.]|jgi:uncharacterized repeat protein (TIGR04076 family)
MDKINSVCEINIQNTALKTEPFCRTCRYHKKQGQSFKSGRLFPRGFCPHAYRAIYPYALALLYNAQYPDDDGKPVSRIKVRCPGFGSYIEIMLSVERLYPAVLRKLKDAAISFLHRLDVPAEYPDKNVIIEVCAVRGDCRFNVKKEDRFKFNLFNRSEICPASLYALYPALVSPSGGKAENSSAHCPDPAGVSYKIENRSFSCADFLKEIKIVAGTEPLECHNQSGRGKEYGFDEKICPLAFYSAFPYYWTYIHSGKFDWVRKNERVSVQCPHVNGIVMEIELSRYDGLGDGAVKAEIIRAGNDCAYGYKKGDSFVLDSGKQNTCYELLISMVAVSAAGEKTNYLSCPGAHTSRIFAGEKKADE